MTEPDWDTVAEQEIEARRDAAAWDVECNCPCDCPRVGQRDDDGTPGWCDPCRMNIHAEDANAAGEKEQ